MPIKLACPNCGEALQAPDDAAGQIFGCPKCQCNLTVPKSTGNSESLSALDLQGGIPGWIWAVVAVGACVPIALVVVIATQSGNPQPTNDSSGQVASSTNPASALADAEVEAQTPISVKNPTMGDLHKILVPAGYLVDTYDNNMAWKKGDEAIYFEVSGSGNGQIEREITVLTLFKGGNQIWSSRQIKVESNKVYVLKDDKQWVQLYTETTSQAASASNSAPEQTTNDGLRSSSGAPGVVRSERTSPQTTPSTGSVNYSLVQTFKNSWRDEGWRHKSKSEQAQALALMIQVVQTDIKNPADQQATLDYIQRTIDSW